MITKRSFKTKDVMEVTFEVDVPGASRVDVVGEWNLWEPVPMKRGRGSETFRAKVRLPTGGEYQFRYRVDGAHWVNDDAADAYVDNVYGDKNGVVSTS
jgi:1,4-alpha-glucan branching enzyme